MEMVKNQIFKATDKIGRIFRYKYIGENKQSNGYNIELINLYWNERTFVEDEWFNQRKIELEG